MTINNLDKIQEFLEKAALYIGAAQVAMQGEVKKETKARPNRN